MVYILWAGSALGAVIGLAHAIYLYRRRFAGPDTNGSAALYRGLWTFLLWTLFGSYLLVLWAVAVVVYSIRKVIPGRSNA